MTPDISVVVPVYNVEKTLERCLESILAQTFRNYEIILVDDGSTDKSGEICDQYAGQYENIRVYHKENEGLGPTRNLGIRHARGEFIYHCDSDDWIDERLLEQTYAAITEAKADVCIFGYQIFTEKNGEMVPFNTISVSDGHYTERETVRRLFTEQYFNSFVVMSACNRLYRKSFLLENDIFFPALRRCQDMAYSLSLFDKIERLVTLHEPYYYYVIEPGVFKGRAYEEMIETYLTVYQYSKETFEKWGLLSKQLLQQLENQMCEHIANYSAYAFVVKFRNQWKETAAQLIDNPDVCRLFSRYKNTKHSKFMLLFCLGVRLRAKRLLLEVSKYVRNRVRNNEEKGSA